MTASVFPITLRCDHTGWSAYDFRDAFLAAKPAGLTYYAYDTIIHSRTEVEFVAYDMLDNCYGGVGKEKARFRATVSRDLTDEAVKKQVYLVAQDRRERELDQREELIIRAYAAEIERQLD
jgi:hypothetical protein